MQDSGFPDPGIGMPANFNEARETIDARDPKARQILLDGAIEGHVLVKNTKNTLPLKSPQRLSLYGYSAESPPIFAPLRGEVESYTWKFGAQAVNAEEVYSGFTGKPYSNFSTIGFKGTMIHGGGSGATTPALFTSPFQALHMRAVQNGTALFYDFESPEPLVSWVSDPCIVFGNAWASESYDRPAIQDGYTDDLIKSVASQCNQTIVVFHNAGTRLVDQFVDHPNVTAIIFAHLPGQETGPAIMSLLYGDSNFSGKLPYTVAKNASDYGSMLKPSLPEGKYTRFPQSNFDEGIFIDYRHFDKNEIEPRYEFGFGLSYTTFEISDLEVQRAENVTFNEWPIGEVVSGGQSDLWDHILTITARIQNTGEVSGAEVAQIYLGIPSAPAKQLRGFEKRFLDAGDSTIVRFNLTRRDLSVWNTEAQKWQLQRGEYLVFLGTSSRQLPLNGIFLV